MKASKLCSQGYPYVIFRKNFPRNLLRSKYASCICTKNVNFLKAHSLCKQCLHDPHFLKRGSFSPDISNVARADISCHFMKTRSLCRTLCPRNGF